MLELQNIAVDHGNLRALWDVSLKVGTQECVGLLGANGAGKSTTIGAVIGLYPIAAGRIAYAGADSAGRNPAQNVAAGISLVPEGRRLFAEMSVEENLTMGAYARDARGRVAEGLERTYGLFPILKAKRRQDAGELSGGQQQMVAIGRALMSYPKLLLLDEPFIGVAPLLVEEISGPCVRSRLPGLRCCWSSRTFIGHSNSSNAHTSSKTAGPFSRARATN